MASPQQRPDPGRQAGPDPNRRPTGLQALEGRGLRSRGSGAGWFAWWWVWLAVIICAIWFAGWGWGGYGGWWWGNRGAAYNSGYYNGAGRTGTAATGAMAGTAAASGAGGTAVGAAPNVNMVSGPGAAMLSATDKRTFIGESFQINGAVVTKKVNNHVMWIGLNNNRNSASMLVVLQGAGNSAAHAPIAQGDRVNVTGRIDQAPAAARAKRNWKLSGNGQNRLEQEGAYVAASQVARQRSGNNG
jgi:hypothetical protein